MAGDVVTACFSVLCVCAACIAVASVWIGARRALHDLLIPAFILVPLAASLQVYENAALAYASAFSENSRLDSANSQTFSLLRTSVQSWIVPTLLLSEVELALTVYRERSFPLGCLSFDSGVSETRVAAVRLILWLWAAALHFLLQVANAAADQPNACAEGCIRFSSGRIPWDVARFDAADILPPVSLLIVGLYIGRALWVYGTTASTDVHPSSLNAWSATFLATLGMLIAYFMTPASWEWPLAINAALILLTAALGYTTYLVQINREQLGRWRAALEAAHESEIAQAAMAEQTHRFADFIEDVMYASPAAKYQDNHPRNTNRRPVSSRCSELVHDMPGPTPKSMTTAPSDTTLDSPCERDEAADGTVKSSDHASVALAPAGNEGDGPVLPGLATMRLAPSPATSKSPGMQDRLVSQQTRDKVLRDAAMRGGGIIVIN